MDSLSRTYEEGPSASHSAVRNPFLYDHAFAMLQTGPVEVDSVVACNCDS